MRSPLQYIFIGVVRLYQLVVSPILGPRCRFQPTCSAYAMDAIKLHGGLKGGWLAIRRIVKCHPWGGHGFDPVPGMKTKAEELKILDCNDHSSTDVENGKEDRSTDG